MSEAYDIVIAGGGFAGSSLALALADRGLRILIAEAQTEYQDRVRGEAIMPWGVAEAGKLGIDKVLLSSCAREVKLHREMWGGGIVTTRHLDDTTPHGRGYLCFPHTEMQESLLRAAQARGVEVWRSATVIGLEKGSPHVVTVASQQQKRRLVARFVVGADGRGSRMAAMAGFQRQFGVARTLISGIMLRDFLGPQGAAQHLVMPGQGRGAVTFPLDGKGLTRAYIVIRRQPDSKLIRGTECLPIFVERSIEAGMNGTCFAEAKVAGPLLTYEGTHQWVDRPYLDGVALVGDAASTSDPTYGNGLALAARDVRELRDSIVAHDDLDAAGRAYARNHQLYYHAMRRIEDWLIDLLYDVGEEADERRRQAFPAHRRDRTRMPDMLGLGPEAPSDDVARERFFGTA